MGFFRPITRAARLSPTLKPFANNVGSGFEGRLLPVCSLVLFCFVYGATFSLFAPVLLVPLAGLLVVPALLVVWALPNMTAAPTRSLEVLLFAFFGFMILWPNYLAISLPGLPWITLSRLVQAPFVVVLLTCVSVSRHFRERLSSAMAATPWLARLIGAFVILQAISIAFSSDLAHSINNFVVAQISYTSVFAASCYIFSGKEKSKKMVIMLCTFALILSAIGLLEYHLDKVPWAGHVPSFLQINDTSVQHALEGSHRWAGRHRVETTYTTALGFAEFITLVFPFAIYFAVGKGKSYLRFAPLLLIPLFVLMVFLTQARIGFVGIFITSLFYPLAWNFVRWWHDRENLFSAAVVFFSPLIVAMAIASVFFVGRIHQVILGYGAEQSSTQARVDQVRMGIPKILHQVWGYGIGQGAVVLGYHNPGGQLTIDSYWLRLALEYGILGLILFIAIFLVALYYALRGALAEQKTQNEESLFIPIACALLNFIIIKAAFAQEDNLPIAFLLFGMLAAQLFRTNSAPNSKRDFF